MSTDQDSRARTHLANERTFLAWFRTGLALMALGIAADQFLGNDLRSGAVVVLLATTLIGAGAALVLFGLYRYRRNRLRIDQNTFEPALTSVDIATAAALAAALIAVVFVWVVRT